MCVLFGVGCNGLPLFAVVCLLCFAFVWAVVRTLIVVCPIATYVFFLFLFLFFVERRGGCFFGEGAIVVLFFVMILLSSATIHACSRRRNRSGPQAHCHKEGCMESRCVSSTLSWAVPFGSYPIGITTIANILLSSDGTSSWNSMLPVILAADVLASI